MSSQWGKAFSIQLFGESHGPAVGVVLEGLPAGFSIDWEALGAFLRRRAGGGQLTTARRESDIPEVLSGVFQGRTTGTPLTLLFRNQDARSEDYDFLPDRPRPGHGDYPAWVKSHGYEDLRGGGHHSGRLTLPYAAVGGIALQLLEKQGIRVEAKLLRVGDASREAIPAAVEEAMQARDSLGGLVEVVATGVAPGLGEPYFEGLEALAALHLFSIPGVKAVEFGAGLAAAGMRGSQYNDPYAWESGKVITPQNNAGGALGGITTGMPIVARVAFRPTASIGKPQQTISLGERKTVSLELQGRHDPCIALRALPVVEGALAVALSELWLCRRGNVPVGGNR